MHVNELNYQSNALFRVIRVLTDMFPSKSICSGILHIPPHTRRNVDGKRYPLAKAEGFEFFYMPSRIIFTAVWEQQRRGGGGGGISAMKQTISLQSI